MYLEDVGHIQINFEDDMEEEGGFLSDFLPYAVLSQVAGYPLRLLDNGNYDEFAFHLTLLYTLGSDKHFLRRADTQSLHNMKPHSGYDFAGIGYAVSGTEGIIEPIVQSIQKCFGEIPDHIIHLYERAFEENNFLLLWRIYLALREMIGITDDYLSELAEQFITRFHEFFKTFMADFLSSNYSDPNERESIRHKLIEMNRNIEF